MQVLLDWISNQNILLFTIYSIVFQFIILLILIFYAIFLRIMNIREEKYRKKTINQWYGPLFEYLEDEIKAEDIKKIVPKKDLKIFSEFIKDFFFNLKGSEKGKLTSLLIHLGYDKYFFKKLQDKDLWVRAQAVNFLGIMACHSAIPELRKKLADEAEIVRITTANILIQMNDLDSLPQIFEKMSEVKSYDNLDQIYSMMLGGGPNILPVVEDVFHSHKNDSWIATICVKLFGNFANFKMSAEILDLFNNTEERELKIASFNSLTEFEDPTLQSIFEKYLENKDFVLQALAIKGLGKLGDDASLPLIINKIKSENFWVAKRAIEAALLFGEEGLENLKHILQLPLTENSKNLVLEALEKNNIPLN